MAGARAWDGAHHRARHLPPRQRPRRPEALPQHRHPHRGRRGGDPARAGSPHRARAQGSKRNRGADGARLTLRVQMARMADTSTAPAAHDTDVAIIGGGMVGASLALGLAGTGVRVLLVESTPFDSAAQTSFDERSTALGNASRRIFAGLGVWDTIAPAAAAIRAIHVSDAGRFGFSRLDAREQGVDALGYVVANRAIGAALWGALERSPGITLRVPARAQALEISAQGAGFTLVDGAGSRERV